MCPVEEKIPPERFCIGIEDFQRIFLNLVFNVVEFQNIGNFQKLRNYVIDELRIFLNYFSSI